jgi:virginiamycin B lyase
MIANRSMYVLIAAGVMFAGPVGSGPALAGSPAGLSLNEWQVPWENTRPRDPAVKDPERIWFVGQRGDYVAMLDPCSGEFERHDLDAGAGPHTVIVDERGAWYAGNRAQHIGLIDPDSGEIEKIMLPGDGRRDPHTMDFTSTGNIWFSVQGGNQLGYLDTEARQITIHDVATPGARPYGLVVDEDDRPWATLFGTNKLATMRDGEIHEIELPRPEARPRRIAVAGGAVWYVDYAGGYLGRYDPDSGEIDEWAAPAGSGARPYAMAADDVGRLWFVETGIQPNRFVGFDPDMETFTEPVEIASGGGTVRHMVFDPETRTIWFGTDTNTIGRAALE